MQLNEFHESYVLLIFSIQYLQMYIFTEKTPNNIETKFYPTFFNLATYLPQIGSVIAPPLFIFK